MHPDSWRYRGCLFLYTYHSTSGCYDLQATTRGNAKQRAPARRNALKGDLSAPKTPATPTLANEHERPPGARTGTKNGQPRANTHVQKLQTLKHCFTPYALVGRFSVLGIFPHPVLILFCPAISRAAVLVCAGIYPGMILCESSPYGMADITIVGYLVHLYHPWHD